MAITIAKFQPEGVAEFQVKNITVCRWGVSREPGPNGHIGRIGHDIHTVTIVRHKSLQDGGKAKLEDETVKLAAASEKKAYFKGTVTAAQEDDSTNIVEKLSWDSGHICHLAHEISDNRVIETMDISVTGLKVNDSEFKRVKTV